MALSTTGKLGLAAGIGGASAIITNGLLRAYAAERAEDGSPSMWFYYSPWIGLGGVAAASLAVYYLMGKSKDAALVAAISGALAALAVPANDYALTSIRDPGLALPTTPPSERALRGAGHLARAGVRQAA